MKLLLMFLFFAVSARAEIIASIGQGIAFEKNEIPGEYDTEAPFALRAGYKLLANSLLLEYSQYSKSNGEGPVLVSEQHSQFIMWVRHEFLSEAWMQPYLQIGPGVDVSKVQTNFYSQTSNDTTQPEPTFAMAAGLKKDIDHILLELELRGMNPNFVLAAPVFGAGVFVGYAF